MMSAAEVIAEIQTLTPAERASVIEKTLPQLSVEQLKLIDRQLRRLANPEVPDSFWDGIEDSEDGRVVDMETALYETPPPSVLDRTLPRP